jgi:hypothetical protein
MVLVFRQAASKLENWTETASGAMTMAALLGCVGVLVHSFLDFNLRDCRLRTAPGIAPAPRASAAQHDCESWPGSPGILSGWLSREKWGTRVFLSADTSGQCTLMLARRRSAPPSKNAAFSSPWGCSGSESAGWARGGT